MISIIVCSKDKAASELHQRNIKKTIGCDYEYIRIDNTAGQYGLCTAYNKGVEDAKGDVVVFMHEDAYFMQPEWGWILIQKFIDHPDVGLIGVAGTQYLRADNPGWVTAGQPFIKGKIIHDVEDRFFISVYSDSSNDAEVVAVDGLFMAVRKSLFETISFDAETFDTFHFYDLDFCVQAARNHRLIVTCDIAVLHQSKGVFSEEWEKYGRKFLEKHKMVLPLSCVPGEPGPVEEQPYQNYDLTGKIPRVVPV